MKKITFILVIITLLLSFGMTIFQNPLLANTENNKEELRDKYLNIMTVNKPQADMVKIIVKNKHNVQYMFTDEQDIKNFDVNSETIGNVSNMDLFLYNGVNFEPWIDEFIGKLKKGNIGIINLARGIRVLSYSTEDKSKENPYYFTGIEEYKIALSNVKNSIQDKDPKNREYYERNYNDAVKLFEKQLNNAKEKIKYLNDYTFLTVDGRFDYLLDDLGVKHMSLNNEYIDKFIENNNLESSKVVFIQDGEDKIDLDNWIYNKEDKNFQDENKIPMEANEYNVIELWKYYGDMSFNDLILYNINEISDFALQERTKNENSIADGAENINEN